MNCGYILQAITSRLLGVDNKAVAAQMGPMSLADIENKLGVTVSKIENINSAFEIISNKHAGVVALLVIISPWQYSHAVILTKQQDNVVIIEGQQWGNEYPAGIYVTAEEAINRYGMDVEVWLGVVSN